MAIERPDEAAPRVEVNEEDTSISDHFGLDRDIPLDPEIDIAMPDASPPALEMVAHALESKKDEPPLEAEQPQPQSAEPEAPAAQAEEAAQPVEQDGEAEVAGGSELTELQQQLETAQAVIAPLVELDPATGVYRYKDGVKEFIDNLGQQDAKPATTKAAEEAMQNLREELMEQGMDEEQVEAMQKMVKTALDAKDQQAEAAKIDNRYNEVIEKFVASKSDFKAVFPQMRNIFDGVYGSLSVAEQKQIIASGKVDLELVYTMAKERTNFAKTVETVKQEGVRLGQSRARKGSPHTAIKGGGNVGRGEALAAQEPTDESQMSTEQIAESIVEAADGPVPGMKKSQDPLRQLFGDF